MTRNPSRETESITLLSALDALQHTSSHAFMNVPHNRPMPYLLWVTHGLGLHYSARARKGREEKRKKGARKAGTGFSLIEIRKVRRLQMSLAETGNRHELPTRACVAPPTPQHTSHCETWSSEWTQSGLPTCQRARHSLAHPASLTAAMQRRAVRPDRPNLPSLTSLPRRTLSPLHVGRPPELARHEHAGRLCDALRHLHLGHLVAQPCLHPVTQRLQGRLHCLLLRLVHSVTWGEGRREEAGVEGNEGRDT